MIQMYHFRLKWERCMVWLQLFGVGLPTPTFCQMGVLNSCFQNSSESSDQSWKNPLVCSPWRVPHAAGRVDILTVSNLNYWIYQYIWWCRTSRNFKNFPPRSLILCCQDRGLINDILMVDWIKTVWGQRPGGLLKTKSLLVLNGFRCRKSENVRELLKMNYVQH